ncbi:unnamed protein product, partial [Didymodactylos carnosus]
MEQRETPAGQVTSSSTGTDENIDLTLSTIRSIGLDDERAVENITVLEQTVLQQQQELREQYAAASSRVCNSSDYFGSQTVEKISFAGVEDKTMDEKLSYEPAFKTYRLLDESVTSFILRPKVDERLVLSQNHEAVIFSKNDRGQ